MIFVKATIACAGLADARLVDRLKLDHRRPFAVHGRACVPFRRELRAGGSSQTADKRSFAGIELP